jgi:hypothetical protein
MLLHPLRILALIRRFALVVHASMRREQQEEIRAASPYFDR